MNAEQYRRAREVFVRAIEISRSERAVFVETACGGQADLRVEVESLLAAHEQRCDFDSLAAPRRAGAAPPLEFARLPEHIGSYRVLDLLGEGGMGVVYLAEQDNPRRTVALKVLHPGIASTTRIKRFQHEAQILGRLHHPGIAQVYEAGMADSGAGPQPYLAMELVEGKPLVEHADAGALSSRERLELLVLVCRAAHHAHERGVIHRDLKPGNILVDEHGAPKILDFGIARATEEDLHTRTMLTGEGEVLGTLPYMSPEQLVGDRADVDARADVYALGVIGYELLSGSLPIDVSRKSLVEAARAVREEEPLPLGAVKRELRGDLETIFFKALDKERGRRYATALALAEDMERWLRQEPIVARPASTMYQLAKFARRNRVLVGGVAGVFAALVLGIVGTSWQALRATEEAARALDAKSEAQAAQKDAAIEADRARAAEKRALIAKNEAQEAQKAAAIEAERARTAEKSSRAEAQRARASYGFIEDTLRSADPQQLGREVKVVDVLDQMASRVGSEFASDPEGEANVRHTIGLTYYTLGRWGEAEQNLRRSLDLHRQVFGAESPDAAALEYLLGVASMSLGKLEEAVDLLQSAREHALETPGSTHFNDSMVATRHLAEALTRLGRLEDSATMLREMLATEGLGPTDPIRGSALAHLGVVLRMQGRLDEAVQTLERALEIQEGALGPEDPDSLSMRGAIAAVRHAQGRYEEAAAINVQVLEVQGRVLGEENPITLTTMENLAQAHAQLGHHDEAGLLLDRTLQVRKRVLGSESSQTLLTKLALVQNYYRQRREEEMERLFEEVLQDIPRIVGGECVETVLVRSKLSRLRLIQGRANDAEVLAREAFLIARDRLELDRLACAEYGELLGSCLIRLDRFEEAEERLGESSEIYRTTFGDGDPRARRGLELLVALYKKWNKPEEEAKYARRLGSDQ